MLINGLPPLCTRSNFAVVPGSKETLAIEQTQMLFQRLTESLILMGVAVKE
jgi:hypothetical protein